MFSPDDLNRLRQTNTDSEIYRMAYSQDANFRSIADKVNGAAGNLNPLEQEALPTALLNRVYKGKWYDNDPVNPLTSSMVHAVGYSLAPQPIGQGLQFSGQPGEARTDRNNNPTAMTTDLAKQAGLQEGVDYVQGDPFQTDSGSTAYTAKFLGDPVNTTIKAIDKTGFYTGTGAQRWTHTAMDQKTWSSLSYDQKANVVAQMYQKEGGSGQLLQQQQGQQYSLGGFMGNILPSAGNLVKNVAGAALHPIKTASFLGHAAIGGVVNAVDALTGAHFQGSPEAMQDAGAIGQFLKQRYGGIDNIKQTAYKDPVGFLTDIASLLSAGGGAIAGVGKLGELGTAAATAGESAVDLGSSAAAIGGASSAMQGAGSAIAGAGEAINPLAYAGKAVGSVAGKVGKFAASQFSGLDQSTLSQLPTAGYAAAKAGDINPESLAESVGSAIDQKADTLSDTGQGYDAIRSQGGPISLLNKDGNPIMKVLEDNGIKMGNDGQLVRTLSTTPMKPGDLSRIQDFVDLLKDDQGNVRSVLSPEEFLNARQNAGLLASYEQGSSSTSAKIGNELYQALNENGRHQIPGLEDLDKQYGPQVGALKQLRKEFLTKGQGGDYELKSNAISKIMNATGKYKSATLDKLEELVPGITQKIHAIHALQDVTTEGMKVGTYFRGIVEGGSILSGNIPGIIGSIIASPPILEKVLMAAGVASRSSIGSIVGKVIAGIPLSASEARMVSVAVESETKQSSDASQTTPSEDVQLS